MKPMPLIIFSMLLVAVSHAAVVTSAETIASSIQRTSYLDEEGGGYVIRETASALASVTPVNIDDNTTQIKLSLLAPAGQKFLIDSSAYGFNPTFSFNVCLSGFSNLSYFASGSVLTLNLLNPQGVSISSSSYGPFRTSYFGDLGYWEIFSNIDGSGSFNGIEVTYSIGNFGTQSLTWNNGDIVSPPAFSLDYRSATDNGPMLSSVPEPSTYALLGLSALGLMIIFRRRVA